MQSRANPSPREFPANREKYREIVYFWVKIPRRFVLLNSFNWSCCRNGVKRNREFLGDIREFDSLLRSGSRMDSRQTIRCRECWKAKPFSLLNPVHRHVTRQFFPG